MTNIFDYDHTAPTEQCSVKVDEHNNSAVCTNPTHEFSEPDAWPIDSRLDDLTRDEFMMLHNLFESRELDPVLAIRVCPDGAPILRTKDVLIFPRMKLAFDSYTLWADSVWYRREWQDSERYDAVDRRKAKSAVVATSPKKASKQPIVKPLRITGERLNSGFMGQFSARQLDKLRDITYTEVFDDIEIHTDGSYELRNDYGTSDRSEPGAFRMGSDTQNVRIAQVELQTWFGNNAIPAQKACDKYIMSIGALVEKIGTKNARFILNSIETIEARSVIFNANGTFNYVHDHEVSQATPLPDHKSITLDFPVQYDTEDLRPWLANNLPQAKPAVAPESAVEAGTRAHQVAEVMLKSVGETSELQFNFDDSESVILNTEGYERLAQVFAGAYHQASVGKGKERHANDLPFHEQRMQSISHMLGSPDGMAYQSIKKLTEGLQLPTHEMRVNELYGVLNYVAGIVIFLEDRREQGYED